METATKQWEQGGDCLKCIKNGNCTKKCHQNFIFEKEKFFTATENLIRKIFQEKEQRK